MTGRIQGTVQDQSNATVPGAAVSAVNQETGYRTEVSTGQGGDYVLPNLPPGKYTVTVTSAGFKGAVSKNVAVIVDGLTDIDFTLQVGARADTVQVDAGSQLVDTVTSSMGNDLSTRQVNALPLFGRVYSQLVQVMPGAVKTGIGSSAESGSGIGANGSITASVNGIVYQGTTFTLDGVSDMELENAFQNVTPPMDDIAEVKVSGNNSSADVGTYGGAQVNAMIKSGTNQFHGTAFEFYRGRSLNANTWANDLIGAAKPPYQANQYGGSFGGPIKKNRIFFFTGYEGLQLNNGITYTYTVPTPMLANGYFPANFFTKPVYDPLTGTSAGTGTNPTPFPMVTLPGGTYGCSGTGSAHHTFLHGIPDSQGPVGPGCSQNAGRQHDLAGSECGQSELPDQQLQPEPDADQPAAEVRHQGGFCTGRAGPRIRPRVLSAQRPDHSRAHPIRQRG